MKRIVLLMMIMFVVPTLVMPQVSSGDDPQDRLENVASLLTKGAVGKVTVVHLKDSMETRINVSKQALQTLATSTLDFNDGIGDKFGPLLSSVSVKKGHHKSDLRWGLHFYDSKNQEIFSLFVDQFGQYGYVNDDAVLFANNKSGHNLAASLHKITGIRD